MASKADVLLRVEDMLYGMAQVERPDEDVVTIASAGASSMTVATDSYWRRGRYAEIIPAAGAVGEIVVLSADAAAGTGNIRRAQRGTTAAAATALPARVDPRFPRSVLDRMISEAITDSLFPHVWYHSFRSLTFTNLDFIYPLAAEDYHVVDVYQTWDNQKHPFPSAWWIEENLVDTTMSATNRALRLRRVHDETRTVYYTARSKPAVANIASFPDPLVNLLPWKVAALALGGTRPAPNRADPNRQALPAEQESGVVRDWRFFEQQFLLKRQEYQIALRYTEKNVRQDRYQPRRRRRW